MNRWLLNNLATWELGVLIVGGFLLVALVGMKVTWRWLPTLREGESNDVAGVILGVLAAVYGIVLAFVIVALYEEYRQAGSDVLHGGDGALEGVSRQPGVLTGGRRRDQDRRRDVHPHRREGRVAGDDARPRVGAGLA